MDKELFILISDGGDGSYNPEFVLDPVVVQRLSDAYDEGRVDYESCPGVDGDGFHYTTIKVPSDATEESLGISVLTNKDVDEILGED